MKKWMVTAALVLGACSGGGWTDAQEDQWRDECLNSPSSCECMLEWFQDNGYSFDDIAGEDGFSIGFRAGQECGL